MRLVSYVVILVAGLLNISGCEGAPPSTSTFAIRDSAGVRITSNPDTPLPSWSVSDEPILSIGSVEGEDGHDLSDAWSSITARDGQIAVANVGTSELRLFSADGTLRSVAGGRGEGPGEFNFMARLVKLSSDSIVAADGGLPRLSVFSSAGAFGRTIPLRDLEGRLPRLRGLLTDGVGLFRVAFAQRGGGRSRAVRDTLLMALTAFDDVWIEVGRFPAAEKFNQVLSSGGVATWNGPFSRDVHTAVGHGLAWIAVSDNYLVQGFDTVGAPVARIRLERERVPVTEALKRRFVEYHLSLAEGDDDARMRRALHSMIEFPESLPAFSDMQLDSEGWLWIKEYTLPWQVDANHWRVFDTQGIARAEVDLPSRLEVHEIGEDFVRGRWTDELDIEYIRSYPLSRRPI